MTDEAQRAAHMKVEETRRTIIGGIAYVVTSHFDREIDIGPSMERLAYASVLGE